MEKDLNYYLSLPYRIEIVPDPDGDGFTACYPDLPGCITSADSLWHVAESALDAKKVWIEAALEDGITIPEPIPEPDLSTYSGQFKLRIPKSLHRSLSLHARREGISMNQYCLYLLTKNDSLQV